MLRVYNTGDMATGTFKVKFTLSDNGKNSKVFKTLNVVSLAAMQDILLDMRYTFPDSIYGKQITAVIDSRKNILELDETNNGCKIFIGPSKTK